MRNFTWVCFWCRTASRRSPIAKDVRCRSCAQPCEYLGEVTAVPSKSKVREWDALRESFYRWQRIYRFGERKRRVRRIHELEREIVRLESLPAENDRVDALNRLRRKLAELRT